MKRALLVGIDEYDRFNALSGCVNDVLAVHRLLATNADGSPNFDCRTMQSDRIRVERRELRQAVATLLGAGADIGLLYFAGHGAQATNDVYLATQDGASGDPGVALSDVLGMVRQSPIPEIVIILDCCFSGAGGGVPQLGGAVAVMRDGSSLLSASRGDQGAAETRAARGAFSSRLCAALDGGAADVLGRVTLAGVYAYVSESFGPWDQRPVLKANLDRLHEIRHCPPALPVQDLRTLPGIFREWDRDLPLDPSYEPTAEPKNEEHEAIFAILQHCRAAKLVVPVGEEHMFDAAMNAKACRLTPLGVHYWQMAKDGRL
jgi:hypothetical protein